MKNIVAFLILTLSTGCVVNKGLRKIETNSYSQDKESNYYAFVGRKLSIEEFTPIFEEGTILLDSAFLAEYEVVKQYKGDKLSETVRFEAYDHYGYPPFADDEIALIYLIQEGERLYHVKYTFDKVKPYGRDKWVSCGTTKNWKGEALLKPRFLWNGFGCILGNMVDDVIEAREKLGNFDY